MQIQNLQTTLTVETENNTKTQSEMLWLANYPKGQM